MGSARSNFGTDGEERSRVGDPLNLKGIHLKQSS